MNSGTYTWHLDSNLTKQILHAKRGDKFESNVFQIGQLKWRVQLYPTGLPGNEQCETCCVICMALLGIPSAWKSIFCQFRIECPQLQSKMVFPQSYNKPYSWGCVISSFEELKSSINKQVQLTFVLTTLLTRITLKWENKTLFQRQTNEYKRNSQLQWKIGQEMMGKLKSVVEGEAICSDIYDDIWCLKLYPKGQLNNVVIRLCLCGLPPDVSKMRVQWTVHCHEANIKQTKTHDFDQQNREYGGNNNTILCSEFCKYNTWTMSVNIVVLNEFDMNGKEIKMKQRECTSNEYKEPQNEEQIPNTVRSTIKATGNQNNKIEQSTEESKEERTTHLQMDEMMKQMSVLEKQMNEILSANAQSKQQAEVNHSTNDDDNSCI